MDLNTLKAIRQAVDENDLGRVKRLLGPERVCEYFAQYTDNLDQFVYVDRPKTDWNYEDFRVFIGPLSEMHQVDVKNTIRYRDGGTTLISLGDGTCLRFPSSLKREDSTHDEVILKLVPIDTVSVTLVTLATTVIDEIVATDTGIQVNEFSGRKRTRISKVVASGGATQHNVF
jgi:hypothetical protein